ncbi:DNA repair protein [unidentified eubacterium SCB49]|nr:DNA repair protein [unidentified eubacterium SCB49]
MISTLLIKNYALIDDIKVDFDAGLTIITGETGAGKSILLGALGLLLGKRADLSAVRDASKKCIIEGEFILKRFDLSGVFASLDIDYDSHTIIRRELLPSGKSRSFVNDTPVTLQQLQGIAPFLVDIHSQHETMTVASEKFQMEMLDAVANNNDLLIAYQAAFNIYKEKTELLASLLKKKEAIDKELDYNSFLFNELQEVNLKKIDQLALESELETLQNSEEITEKLSEALQLLSADEIGVIAVLKEVRVALGRIKTISTPFNELWERVQSVIIELEDIDEEINISSQNVETAPEILEQVTEKLQLVYQLQQKHKVQTVAELIEIEAKLGEKIDVTGSLDNQIALLEADKISATKKLDTLSKKLHKKRVDVFPVLKQKLETVLYDLGLPNASFTLSLEVTEAYKNDGKDALQLLFTANKGLQPGLLKKVASGGELSRIMLAIKAILAEYKQLPTIIFDEIDTGVSGEIALKMAYILEQMGGAMQLVSITHLPQIASKGKHHLKVFKKDIDGKTATFIERLTKEDRVKEIAMMLGGQDISNTALEHATQLLK